MSLSGRIERAQRAAEVPDAGKAAPLEPRVAARLAGAPAREELLRDIKLRLQDEVINALGSRLDVVDGAEIRSRIE